MQTRRLNTGLFLFLAMLATAGASLKCGRGNVPPQTSDLDAGSTVDSDAVARDSGTQDGTDASAVNDGGVDAGTDAGTDAGVPVTRKIFTIKTESTTDLGLYFYDQVLGPL